MTVFSIVTQSKSVETNRPAWITGRGETNAHPA